MGLHDRVEDDGFYRRRTNSSEGECLNSHYWGTFGQ